MTHDQLARVFPDGRTVHVPSDGSPLKGYELARADIEKRGDGDDAATKSVPNLFAALFKSKSNDDEDEGASAPVVSETTAPASVMAAAAPAKSAYPLPLARAARSVPPIRNRPQASPPPTRHWPTRRHPMHRSTALTSSPPAHRSRAASARRQWRAIRWPPPG